MPYKNTLRLIASIIAIFAFYDSKSQLPNPAIVGYWENWVGNNYVKLKNIDPRYNVIQISFAERKNGNDYEQQFLPPLYQYTDQSFKNEMAQHQNQGKKILISIGGQNGVIVLDTEQERDAFITSINDMVDYWGFDGIDIDLEGNSLNYSNINIQNPGDPKMVYMIEAIQTIMKNHYNKHGEHLLLTMAPETFYVQGALSHPSLGAHRGAYLPIIEALRDSIDMLNVQLYNSGSMYGLDNQVYTQGTGDWILAMTEAVIQGFTVNDLGTYSGLPASKVGVGLPGCHSSDAVPHLEMEAAIRYLKGETSQKTGNYNLIQQGGYPDLRGMMTWSINSDKACSPSYGFVDTWSQIFTNDPYVEIGTKVDIYEGAEDGKIITVNLFNDTFATTLDTANWTITGLPSGVEIDTIIRENDTTASIVLKGNTDAPYISSNWGVKATVGTADLQNSTSNLTRGTGVILKKAVSQIPGKMDGEAYVSHSGASVGTDWEDSNNHFVKLDEKDYAEIEAEVSANDTYKVNMKYAANGTFKILIRVDGYINSTHTISSSTNNTTWEFANFDVALTKGNHLVEIFMITGAAKIEYLDFSIDNSTTEYHIQKTIFYPNPSSSNIFFSDNIRGNISIYNSLGSLVKTINSDENIQKLNIESFKPGIYMVTLQTEEGNIIYNKLIKK